MRGDSRTYGRFATAVTEKSKQRTANSKQQTPGKSQKWGVEFLTPLRAPSLTVAVYCPLFAVYRLLSATCSRTNCLASKSARAC